MKNSTIRRYTFLLLTLCTVASVAQNTKYVNLFLGTSGDNGQVAPGAAAPFGMVCVCPDNDPRSHAGYDYAVTKVSGTLLSTAFPEWGVAEEEEICTFVR